MLFRTLTLDTRPTAFVIGGKVETREQRPTINNNLSKETVGPITTLFRSDNPSLPRKSKNISYYLFRPCPEKARISVTPLPSKTPKKTMEIPSAPLSSKITKIAEIPTTPLPRKMKKSIHPSKSTNINKQLRKIETINKAPSLKKN